MFGQTVAIEDPQPLARKAIVEPRTVFRFVRCADPDDPALIEDFRSDRDSGKRPLRREKVYPELQDGMSTYGSLDAAQRTWATISEVAAARGQSVRAGDYIAEVALDPGQGFDIEDLGEDDEHLTIWGSPSRLAGAVRRIYAARGKTN